MANIISEVPLEDALWPGAVACSIARTDVILMGTLKQLQRFVEKVAAQPFGLVGYPTDRDLEKSLLESLAVNVQNLQRRAYTIMGSNVTPDSSDGGRFASENGRERGFGW